MRADSYQCNQVPGVLAAEVSTTAEDDQSHKEDCIGHVIRPWITSHKVLGVIDEGEDGNKGESDQKLHCENHEDLVGKRNEADEGRHHVLVILYINTLYYMLYLLIHQTHLIHLTG